MPFDPSDLSTEAVNQLLTKQDLFLSEFAKALAVTNFLGALKAWKESALQAQGKPDYVLGPLPIPPVGYTLPPEVPSPHPPPPSGPIVEEEDSWHQFPATGDTNPAGTKITWQGETLVKVFGKTPFGPAQWWERSKS